MLKGTRLLMGDEAREYIQTIDALRDALVKLGYQEVIVPSIWETDTFANKLGPEKEGQMWTFQDKCGRNCCLVPEITGIIQQEWRDGWVKSMPKPTKLFYVARCYRYDRPQMGRYREFTQVGVEILGGKAPQDMNDIMNALMVCTTKVSVDAHFVGGVARGLSYYTEEGFEVECDKLGTQKQIAGGGRYKEGVGWALGVERLILGAKK